MSARPLRILLNDDHELVRDGLKRILLDSGIADHVGEAGDGPGALEAVRREKWDVVILDLNLGGRSGMEVLKEIRAEFPAIPVLVLSIYAEEQFALRAIRAGASGYVNKNLATRVLVEAIRQVVAGGHFMSAEVAAQLAGAVQQRAGGSRHAALSDREDQVLRLIGAGETVGAIAAALDLSVKTVSTYRRTVLSKLGLKNNAQLMRYARENGLGDGEGGAFAGMGPPA